MSDLYSIGLGVVVILSSGLALWQSPYCHLCKNRKNTHRHGLFGGEPTCDIHGDINIS